MTHEVASSLVLLEEELRSFVANAKARLHRKALASLCCAAYDASCALLRAKGIHPDSHEGVQSMLSLHFVKAGALPADTTKRLHALMALRHAADYKGDVEIGAGDVREQRAWTIGYVARVLDLLEAGAAKIDLAQVQQALDEARAVRLAADPAGRRRRG
ncbi:MAG: hypothetical protein ACT4P4_29435 [Betaproteobacteria bacterium]